MNDENTKDQNSNEQQTPPPGAPMYPPYYYEEEDEVSLLDLLLVLARNRRLIAITAGVFVVLGLLIAVFSSSEYSSSATLIREIESAEGNLGGGLAALGKGFGLSLGGGTTGLTAEAYPNIIKSREVKLAVVRDKYYFPDYQDSLTLTDYFEKSKGIFSTIVGGLKAYTIGLPGKILSIFKKNDQLRVVLSPEGKPIYPTEEEEDAMEAITGMLSVSVDQETGLMTVSVTTGNPLFSAQLTDSFVEHLKERVRAIRTQKARQNLQFIKERFAEAEQQLNQAEEQLAKFMDRNTNPQTAKLQTERERLQRQVTFKSQLYSEMQTQLTQAQIELQKSNPVITVLEQPVPPLEPSGPKRKLIVILSLFLGGGLGIGLAFVKTFVGNVEEDDEEKSKLQEIKKAFVPERWRQKD